jgi:hypothetical protein
VSHDSSPETACVPLETLVALAIEHWRLARWLEKLPKGNITAQPRHALAKMADALAQCQLETRSLDGHLFDPGLAVRVVDAMDNAQLPQGTTFIGETVSPQVLWRGRVINPADVVTIRGTGQ